jgi:predicted TIM-barrel fold metal-dependent hydrolase
VRSDTGGAYESALESTSGGLMDIVDAQVHLFMTMNDAEALKVMDALGIQSALIDEVWAHSSDLPLMPGYELPGGVWRPTAPGGMVASMRYPDRFSYLLRVDPDDPDIDTVVSHVARSPGGRAVRLNAQTPKEVSAARDGRRADFFACARKHDLPVFVMTRGNAALYEPYIRQYPDLPIIIDHVGVAGTPEQFDELLALAALPNVYIKWCHAPEVFRAKAYPFPEVQPLLERALEAFGPERIMWASDFTAVAWISSGGSGFVNYPWGEALFYMRHNPALSEGDKAWILGGTARKVLRWLEPTAVAASTH